MTQQDLYAVLETLNIPVAYGEFEEAVEAPFITYQFTNSSDIMADNQNYIDVDNYQIELYTEKKDIQMEQKLEILLKTNNLVYSKLETWLNDEKLRQIIYQIQLI